MLRSKKESQARAETTQGEFYADAKLSLSRDFSLYCCASL